MVVPFHSLAYIGFLVSTFGVVHVLPVKHRWIALLIASYIFYGFGGIGIVALLFSMTVTQYCFALCIEKKQSTVGKKLYVIFSISTAVLFLSFFKYSDFLLSTISADIPNGTRMMFKDIVLPLGISFYTFQILGYIVDVYRGEIKAERHLGRFALFVAFFPQLVAGPIERMHNLMPQLKKPETFQYNNAVPGLQTMLWGFFKKLVIADGIAVFVDPVFLHPENFAGWQIIICAVLFSFQIYCDFSGYVDIAIGSARMLGINLSRNFNMPYFSVSVRDFWRRWHITLSEWFRDYLYIPLGGSRVVWWRWCINIMVIFFISGLWHGANWTFIAWGLLHGLWICMEVAFTRLYTYVCGPIRILKSVMFSKVFPWCITMVFICWSFVVFRAESLSSAVVLMKRSTQLHWTQLGYFAKEPTARLDFFIVLVSLVVLIAYEVLRDWYTQKGNRDIPIQYQWVMMTIMLWSIVNLGFFAEKEFIYFRF